MIAGDAAEGTLLTSYPDVRGKPEAAELVTELRARQFPPDLPPSLPLMAVVHGDGQQPQQSPRGASMARPCRTSVIMSRRGSRLSTGRSGRARHPDRILLIPLIVAGPSSATAVARARGFACGPARGHGVGRAGRTWQGGASIRCPRRQESTKATTRCPPIAIPPSARSARSAARRRTARSSFPPR